MNCLQLWVFLALYTCDMYLPAVEMRLAQSSVSLRHDWSEHELKFAITMLSEIPL